MQNNPPAWVWLANCPVADAPAVVYFRRELTLAQQPRRAPCRITADARYIFAVNGHTVCRGPRKGDDKVWFYDEIDLAPWLVAGVNVLAATVLAYPVEIAKGNRSVWRMGKPGLAAWGTVELPGGSLDWHTDESWQAHHATNIRVHGDYPDTSRLFVQEDAAGDAALQGWQATGYDAAAWVPAVVYRGGISHPAVSPAFLRPRPIPFLYEETRQFQGVLPPIQGRKPAAAWESLLHQNVPITLPPRQTATVVLAAEQLTTGYLELAVSGGAGAALEIRQAEGYEQPDSSEKSPRKADRLDWQHGILRGPADHYTVAGCGNAAAPERYEPFWFRCFRLVRLKITVGDEALTLCRVAYRETGYPLDVKTKVETSDPGMAEIWQISENALRACMHETYEDCPFYEQLQYCMDTRAEILYTYASAADDRLGRQAIDDFARSQRANGLLNACYPTCKPNVIPQFSIYYILMLHDHMLYFGDVDFIRRYLPVVQRILSFFTALLGPEGLIGAIPGAQMPGGSYWGFVDWARGWPVGVPPAAAHGPLTMDSLMACMGLQTAAELADYAGWGGLAGQYRALADRLRAGVRQRCPGKNGMLRDGPGVAQYSQHVQVFAALTDTLTGKAAAAALRSAMEEGAVVPCTVATDYYLFRALEKTGLYSYTARLWDTWRRMLKNHLTTCVESDGDYLRSDCHAWGALALYELPCVMLGVRPAAPGYTKVEFTPHPGHLRYAKGRVITPHGPVYAEWRLQDGKIEKKITLPAGITAATE